MGVKAFDGPPLGPGDVKDLLLRNFSVRTSRSEAAALVAHFAKKVCRYDFRAIVRTTVGILYVGGEF